MKSKTYATDKVDQLAKLLAKQPALEPKFLAHEDALEKLSNEIWNLYSKKHYDERQIAAILKENGIKTTLKEIKTLIENRRNNLVKK